MVGINIPETTDMIKMKFGVHITYGRRISCNLVLVIDFACRGNNCHTMTLFEKINDDPFLQTMGPNVLKVCMMVTSDEY